MPPADASSRQAQSKKSAPENPTSAAARNWATQLVWPAVFLWLAFAVYIPSLKFSFILDDHRFTSDPRIQESGHIFDYFSNYVWAQFTGGPPSFYRPAFLLWVRLNYLLSAQSAWGWHFLSITKHLLVAIALWVLIYKLLDDRVVASAAAALFALHPSHTESVSWVTVPDPLLTLALLLSLLFYLRCFDSPVAGIQPPLRKSRKTAEPTQGSSAIWLAASAAAYFAALLAKETAIVFPAVILAFALIAKRLQPGNDKGTETESSVWRRRTPLHVAIFLAVTLLYLLIRRSALNGSVAPATQHLPWRTVALSWPASLWFYVKVLFWPVKSYSYADPTLIQSFSVQGVLLPLIALILCAGAMSAACVWAWKTAHKHLTRRGAERVRFGLTAGGLLVILPLLLTLNLNALNPGDFLHGRYVYLPLAGLSILIAIGLHLAQNLRLVLLCAAGAIGIAFIPLTWSQQTQWQDDATVYTVAHQLAPHNLPVARNLTNTRVQAALLIADDGRCGEAMPIFNDAIDNYPDDWYAWAGRGICYVQENDLMKAEESLHRAADLSHDPHVVEQWQALREHMGLASSRPIH